jgi:hypothetical protein
LQPKGSFSWKFGKGSLEMNKNKFFGIGTAWAAVLAALILAGCSMSNTLPISDPAPAEDETKEPPEETPPAGTLPVQEDDPDNNIMSQATANLIFALANGPNNGWMITGFKSVAELWVYLERSGKTADPARAAVPKGRYEFTVPTIIGSRPVTSIGEKAFSPQKAGNEDITEIAHTINFPETVVEMGKELFTGVAENYELVIPEVVFTTIAERDNVKKEEIVTGGDKGTIKESKPSSNGTGSTSTVTIEEGPPVLSRTEIQYDAEATNKTTVTFTFNNPVTVTGASPGWTIAGGSTTAIKASYSGSQFGTYQEVGFTAVSAKNSNKKTTVNSVKVLTARGFPASAADYTITSYDPALHIAVVKKVTDGSVDGFLAPTAAWQNLFNAIYTPNAPGSTDDITFESPDKTTESPGKKTIPYNETISDAVLKLFKVNIGQNVSTSARVKIEGEDLPTANGATAANLIVIDIGLPGSSANNTGLNFIIPKKGLGKVNLDYRYLRFRVNKGADLFIEADNSLYEEKGAGNSCPEGYFNYGCVEVMAGGQLRDGAYEGFPLGAHAVILNRYNSYLGVGPDKVADNDKMKPTYDAYYKGWLVGPSAGNPKIQWNSGGPKDYLEVRPKQLAISANVTVKQSVGLIYSVWLVGEITVTIDAAKEDKGLDFTINNEKVTLHGLFANFNSEKKETTAYKIYGTKDATIVVNPGNTIHKGFLTPNGTGEAMYSDYAIMFTVDSNKPAVTIPCKTTGSSDPYAGEITGHLGWDVPNQVNQDEEA